MNILTNTMLKEKVIEFAVLLGGIITFLFGPITLRIIALFVLIAIDTLFGMQVAIKRRVFKFKIIFQKIIKKLYYYFLFLTLFNMIDIIIGGPNTFRWIGVLLMTFVELTSILHNIAASGNSSGVYIMKQIIDVFKDQFKLKEYKED